MNCKVLEIKIVSVTYLLHPQLSANSAVMLARVYIVPNLVTWEVSNEKSNPITGAQQINSNFIGIESVQET